MPADLPDEDRELMDRFFVVILERYRNGKIALVEACEDLAQAFDTNGQSRDDFRAFMKAVIEDEN